MTQSTYRVIAYLILGAALISPDTPLASLILLLQVCLAGAYRYLHPADSTPAITHWLIGLTLLWLPISGLWAHSLGWSLKFSTVLLGLPLAWLLGRQLANRGQLHAFLGVATPVALFVLVIWGLWQGPATVTTRPQGPYNDPNLYVAVLNLLILPTLARYLSCNLANTPAASRVLMLSLFGAHALVFALVNSKGASLALAAVLPFLFWQTRQTADFSRKLVGLTGVWLVAYGLATWTNTATASLANRMVEMVAQGDAPRWHLFTAAWHMIQAQPLWGTGLGSFQFLYPLYRNPLETGTAGGWVHNDYLQLWVEAGLPAFLALLILLIWSIRRLLATASSPSPDSTQHLGYLAAIVVTLLHAGVNFLLYFPPVAVLLGFYLATQTSPTTPFAASRAWRLAGLGYGFILGYLMLGLVVVHLSLNHYRAIQQAAWHGSLILNRIHVGAWLSALSPFNPLPRQFLAQEYAELWQASGYRDQSMLIQAVYELRDSQRLLPCNSDPYTLALGLLSQAQQPDLQNLAKAQIDAALTCDPRNGLAYYHAGLILEASDPELARRYWLAGLAASLQVEERLFLMATLLARDLPDKKRAFTYLATRIAAYRQALTLNQPTNEDIHFLREMTLLLKRMGGVRYDYLSQYLASH